MGELTKSCFTCPYDPEEPLYLVYDVNEHCIVYYCSVCNYREKVKAFASVEG